MLPLLVGWYDSELREQGRPDLAEQIELARVSASVSPETMAAQLDAIKAKVGSGSLFERLRELDCSCQLNEPE